MAWAGATVVLCSIAILAFSNIVTPPSFDAPAVSAPAVVTAVPSIKGGSEDCGVVYEVGGDYYHIDTETGANENGAPEPVEATPPARAREKEPTSIAPAMEGAVYVAEDSVGFLAVVVSPGGNVRVYRQADESFLTD